MELWIRSQNKEVLTKCSCLGLEDQSNGKYSILNHSGLEFYQYLGTYDYERALEVLDEIQSYLIPKLHHICDKDLEGNNVKVLGIDSIQTMVYEMPKE